MATPLKNRRTCSNGHTYYKSSDCPTCPYCEQLKKPATGFLSLVAAPARRALERAGINSLQQLSRWTETDLLALHGIGPATLPPLRSALKSIGLTLKSNNHGNRKKTY